MATETQAAVEQQGEWTYLGARDTKGDGHLTHLWLDHWGIERYFKTPLARYPRPGAVYQITFRENEGGGVTAYLNGEKEPRFLRFVDADQRAQCEAAHAAAEASARATKALRSASTDAAMRKALEPIRELMHRTDRIGRRAILATVMDILQS